MKPDYTQYMPLLADTALTESQKQELLDTVYVFLSAIIDASAMDNSISDGGLSYDELSPESVGNAGFDDSDADKTVLDSPYTNTRSQPQE